MRRKRRRRVKKIRKKVHEHFLGILSIQIPLSVQIEGILITETHAKIDIKYLNILQMLDN